MLNHIYDFLFELRQYKEIYETCLEIEKLIPNSTALEKIQALYRAEKISKEEMRCSYKQAYANRKTLLVQRKMVEGLARNFIRQGLSELAVCYHNWAQELPR